ncbi:MAG: hypothetical protein ACRDRJ_21410 [Streptosporangiaceae bacterium]
MRIADARFSGHGIGAREVYGSMRVHTVTWISGEVQVEGVEADDYPYSQVALAWLLRRSPAMVIIPGTANPGHRHADIAAPEVAGNLTDAEVARLTGLADESKAVLDQPHQSTPMHTGPQATAVTRWVSMAPTASR